MFYRIRDFSKLVGVTPSTLRRWEKEGKFKASRREGNQRVYTDEDVQRILRLPVASKEKRIVLYARVSSPAQKDDLASQITALELFARGKGLIFETISEVGGGMNFSRKKFMATLIGIINGDVGTLIVAHKDRLARFGFELVANLCETYGCNLIVMNDEKLSPQQEMVEDLMSIIHTFSCRLYGLRKYKKAEDIIEPCK